MGAERWRLLTTWDASPQLAMGLDEVLLEAAGSAPTLRFYSWRPDTLSLGYFQRLADVAAAPRAGAVVRRITGGGAIHHAAELTFSIALDQGHPIYRGPVSASYERVHAAIAAALAPLGHEALPRGDAALASDRADTGMCFHVSTPLDLALAGRKLLGSAQRRKAERILHHGSIKLGASPLEEGIPGLAGCGDAPPAAELATRIVAELERRFDLACEADEPSSRELARAAELGARYVDPAFVSRR